jgi:uncharacterized membrane protein YgcG
VAERGGGHPLGGPERAFVTRHWRQSLVGRRDRGRELPKRCGRACWRARSPACCDGTAPHERPRGVFSFLTWPFALAQLFAVEEFLGGTSRSAHAEEEQGKSTRSARGEDLGSGIDAALNESRHRSASEEGETADAEAALARPNLIEPSAPEAFSQPRDNEEENGNGADTRGSGASSGGGGGGSGGGSGSGGSDAQTATDIGGAVSGSAGQMTNALGSGPSWLNMACSPR